jgi:hypothetical protein
MQNQLLALCRKTGYPRTYLLYRAAEEEIEKEKTRKQPPPGPPPAEA